MFCENCGNKIKKGYQFCTECGHPSDGDSIKNDYSSKGDLNERWWYRLFRVLYILSYLPLIGIIITVWNIYAPYCYTSTYSYTYNYCRGSYSEAFWYSFLALVIGVVILRLAKIIVVYVTKGQKPQWGKEFKKIY